MNYNYSPNIISKHYVIICDDTGELVSSPTTEDGSWDYREIPLPNDREIIVKFMDNVWAFDDKKEADTLAKTLHKKYKNDYTVITIIKKQVEYFVVE